MLRTPCKNHKTDMSKKTKKKTYKFGMLAEKITILLLTLKGYKIIKWRYKNHFGEIDIIAQKSNIIIAVEVKARRGNYNIEQIIRPKQIEKIKKSLEFFVAKNKKFHKFRFRFDYVEVGKFLTCAHHKNFFS